MSDGVLIRQATEADSDDIVRLAGDALGWSEDERNAELFRWKHRQNPFGPSPVWLAEVDGQLAGLRTFLRWEWRSPSGRVLHTVRAVDTATLPAFQGRGIFRGLTTQAVEELAADGVDFVFNTPNDKSRPGYLSMGWEVIGRVPVVVGVRSPATVRALVRARAAAEKWSLPTTSGLPAAEVLADRMSLMALLDSLAPSGGLRTAVSPAFLQWRYAGGPVTYRAMVAPGGLSEGLVLYRLRRRGAAVEAAVVELLVPEGGEGARTANALLRRVRKESGASYLLAVDSRRLAHRSLPRVDRLGPVLTWRPLAETVRPDLDGWDLRLGDIELF
ncbi:MAG: GNAT family N-acetyltransferase [Acidimicrobiia bacterium]|nr:GNAT family N-acetyltransferase [Acidimicrobiia bacterium]